jgi:hypothetical protein
VLGKALLQELPEANLVFDNQKFHSSGLRMAGRT